MKYTKLSDLFHKRNNSQLENDVCVLHDCGNDKKVLDYGKVNFIAKQVSQLLRKYDISNEVVGICTPSSFMAPSLFLGVLDTPAAFLPIAVDIASKNVESLINRLQFRAFIINTDLVDVFIKKIKRFHPEQADNIMEEFDLILLKTESVKIPNDIAYVITTSGTTGEPKIVKVPHSCIIPNVIHISELFHITVNDVVFQSSPLTFDPSVVEIFVTLHASASLLIVPDNVKVKPRLLCDILTIRNCVTIIQTTPSLLLSLGAERLRDHLLCKRSCLKVLALGGETFPSLYNIIPFDDISPSIRFYNFYGITEVSCWASYYLLNEDDLRYYKDVPLGIPMKSTTIEIYDSNDIPVKGIGHGEIYVGGENRMCYIENQSLTNFLRATGDLGFKDGNGNIWYKGRLDDCIKRNGKRISLFSIELIALKFVYIHRACCILENNLIYLVLLHREDNVSFNDAIKDQFISHLKSYLEQPMFPDYIYYISEDFPTTSHGKVNKKLLMSMVMLNYQDKMGNAITYKEYIHSIFKSLLPHVFETANCLNNNFVDVGGNSILAIQILQKLKEKSQIKHAIVYDLLMNNSIHVFIDKLCSNKFFFNKDIKYEDAIELKRNLEVTLEPHFDETLHPLKKIKVDKRVDLSAISGFISYEKGNKSVCIDCLNHKSVLTSHEKNINMDNFKTSELELKCCVKWKYSLSKCIDASPLVIIENVDKRTIYIGSHSHKFVAMCAFSGKLMWEETVSDRIQSSACASSCGKYVIVGCYDHKLYVFDRILGSIIWAFKTNGEIKCSPCVNPNSGLVYIGSHDQKVYALDIYIKQCLWSTNLQSGSIFASPIYCKDHAILYIATFGGTIFALDPLEGIIEWSYDSLKPIFSDPVCGKYVIVVNVIGCIHCLTHDGALVWKYSMNGNCFSSPCIMNEHNQINNDELIFIGCHDHKIYCLNTNGNLLWLCECQSPIYSTPYIAYIPICLHEPHYINNSMNFDKLLIVVTTNGIINFLCPFTGKRVAKYSMNEQMFSSPICIDNMLYIGSRNDHIYGIEIKIN